MITFTNHTRPTTDPVAFLRHRAALWMRRNWAHYTNDAGVVDVEALTEQAVWEFGVSREVAGELTNELVGEVATTVTAVKFWTGRPGPIEEMLG